MIRSKVWQPEAWPDNTGGPTLAEAMVRHGELPDSVNEMQSIIDNDRENRLY